MCWSYCEGISIQTYFRVVNCVYWQDLEKLVKSATSGEHNGVPGSQLFVLGTSFASNAHSALSCWKKKTSPLENMVNIKVSK